MITLTRNNLTLSFSAGTIPAQGSSKVPIQFVNDESTYVGYTIQPNVGWFNGIVNKEAICEFQDNIIYLPAEAFELSGVINVSIALIDTTDGNHIEVTNKATASVNPAPFGTTVLPSEDTWQTVIENFTNQLFDNYTSETVQPVLTQAQEAVTTANEASTNANQAVQTANTASANVQTAYSNLGNYKVENGILYFMKADGTYNEQGITLAGQSTVTDVNSNPILTAPLTAPPNSVINSDFLSWQREKEFNYQTSSISSNTYMPDCWYVANGSKNFILSQVPKGAHVEIYGAQSYFQITQLIGEYNAGDTVTMVVGITNHGDEFVMQQRIGNSGSNNKSINIAPGSNVFTITYTLQSSDFDSNSKFAIQPFFGYCEIEYANCTINYIRLYPGSIPYSGYKEDYATALMRCQPYVNLITYELTNYTATNSFAIRQSINIPNMVAEPTVTVISEGTQTNIANIEETFPYPNYSCLSVSINSTIAGQVRVYGRTILLSCEGQ